MTGTDIVADVPGERIGADLAIRVHRGSDGSLLHERIGLRAWIEERFICDEETVAMLEKQLLENGVVNIDPPTAPDGGYDLVVKGRICPCCGEPT
jgi:hypothetical protein